jgi:hypothetical protein
MGASDQQGVTQTLSWTVKHRDLVDVLIVWLSREPIGKRDDGWA